MFVVETKYQYGDDWPDGDLYGPFETYEEGSRWVMKTFPNIWTKAVIAEINPIW